MADLRQGFWRTRRVCGRCTAFWQSTRELLAAWRARWASQAPCYDEAHKQSVGWRLPIPLCVVTFSCGHCQQQQNGSGRAGDRVSRRPGGGGPPGRRRAVAQGAAQGWQGGAGEFEAVIVPPALHAIMPCPETSSPPPAERRGRGHRGPEKCEDRSGAQAEGAGRCRPG